MSLFMVIQEAKVYRSFYVSPKNALEAKHLVENGGDLIPHATYPMNGDQELVGDLDGRRNDTGLAATQSKIKER